MTQKHLKETIVSVLVAVVLAGGSFAGGFYTGVSHHSTKTEPPVTLQNAESVISDKVDFSPFWKAWNLLNENFVPPLGNATSSSVSAQDRVWGAITGLTNSYGDVHTTFFPPQDATVFEQDISGNFDGVGMEISTQKNQIVVVAALKDTPAYKAGIKSGDALLKINGTSTANLTVDGAVKLIRGKKGTTVSFTIGRQGLDSPLTIDVVRDTIDIPTIDTEVIDKDVFVIHLYNFSAVSADLFQDALKKFNDSGTHKLILDLRGNPGGYLQAAVDMASWFLPSGQVVVRESYGGNKPEQLYTSKGYDAYDKSLPFIILVDQGSASAAEILSGALQEHGVAKLLGTRTFGKGSVQELFKVTPSTSIKITIARWLTPNGKSISQGGLTPDIEVPYTIDDFNAGIDPQLNKAVQILEAQK